jgi:hypothetical protein
MPALTWPALVLLLMTATPCDVTPCAQALPNSDLSQEEKRALAAAALGDGGGGVGARRLSLRELRHLFGFGGGDAPQFEAA